MTSRSVSPRRWQGRMTASWQKSSGTRASASGSISIFGDVDALALRVAGEEGGQALLGQEPQLVQHGPDQAAGALLLAQGEVELVAVDQARLEQAVAEARDGGERWKAA